MKNKGQTSLCQHRIVIEARRAGPMSSADAEVDAIVSRRAGEITMTATRVHVASGSKHNIGVDGQSATPSIM